MQFKRLNQSGFTLVEIAIVLVIIGLLLGGFLKGQEMITNAKIKSVVNDMNGISAAYNSYLDRYKTVPGDEVAAAYTARGWVGIPGGNANSNLGVLVGATFTNPAAGEGAGLWQSLRAAQMIGGAATSAALPPNAASGLIGVNGAVTYANNAPTVCVSGINPKIALGVDITVDGPLPATGIGNNVGVLRGAANAAAPLAPVAGVPGAAAYNETAATFWTLCRPI